MRNTVRCIPLVLAFAKVRSSCIVKKRKAKYEHRMYARVLIYCTYIGPLYTFICKEKPAKRVQRGIRTRDELQKNKKRIGNEEGVKGSVCAQSVRIEMPRCIPSRRNQQSLLCLQPFSRILYTIGPVGKRRNIPPIKASAKRSFGSTRASSLQDAYVNVTNYKPE